MYFAIAIALMFIVNAAVINGRSIPDVHFPEDPQNGHGICSEFQCSFICHEGYALNGYSEIEWIDGEWNHPVPTCTEESLQNCSELSIPHFSTTRCSNNNALESICTYTCDSGFTLIGLPETTCVLTADEPQWSNSPPVCFPEPEESFQESRKR